ncbi:MAG: ABC transporter substrate-binding protein [Litorilinea sp.]|nr:MAG: ABC transporter substrate-binding protein [Litorilinea sp.]
MNRRMNRRDFLRGALVTGSGILAVSSLSACVAPSGQQPSSTPIATPPAEAQEKVVVFIQGQGNSYGAKPKTLWTGFRFWTNSGQPSRMLWEPLVDLDENLQPVPGLAESWEFEDNQTLRFNLRRDVVWSDGTPITAEDVVFSMNITFHPEARDMTASELSIIKGGEEMMAGEAQELAGVRAVDDHTVIIETATPDTTLALSMGLRWWAPIPKHIYGDIPPGELEQSPEMLAPKVVSGPYFMDREETDRWYEFVPNERYWRGVPPLDRIVYIYGEIGDLVALASQERFHHSWVRNAEVAAAIEELPTYTVIWKPYIQGYRLQFNLRLPKFQDPLFRKAVCYAIDRETLCNDIYKGYATPIYTDFEGDLLDPQAEVYRFDMDYARQLLSQSSWDPNDTVKYLRSAPSGTPNPVAEAEMLAYQEWLGDLGVKMEFDIKPDSASYTAAIDEKQYELFENPHRPYHIYGPLEMHNYLSSGPNSWHGYNNSEVDELIKQSFLLYGTDQEEYVRVARRMSVIVQDEAVFVPTKQVLAANVIHEDFIGLTPIGEAYFTYARPWLWDLRTS